MSILSIISNSSERLFSYHSNFTICLLVNFFIIVIPMDCGTLMSTKKDWYREGGKSCIIGFLGMFCFSFQRYFGNSIISSGQARAKKVLKTSFKRTLVAREVSPFLGVVTSSSNPYNSAIQTDFVPFFPKNTVFHTLPAQVSTLFNWQNQRA